MCCPKCGLALKKEDIVLKHIDYCDGDKEEKEDGI